MRYSNIDSNTQNSTLIFYIARASNTFTIVVKHF